MASWDLSPGLLVPEFLALTPHQQEKNMQTGLSAFEVTCENPGEREEARKLQTDIMCPNF